MHSWLERIPSVVEGYELRNIWNCDETGCYWNALPDKGFAEKKKECKGGKKSKLRVTICFFVNATGESESLPVVIWKSAKPSVLKVHVLLTSCFILQSKQVMDCWGNFIPNY